MAQTQAEFDAALADMQTSIDALTANQAAVAAAVTAEAQQIADFIAAHPAVDTSGLATVQANLAAAVAASGGEATTVEGIFTPA